MWKYVTRRVKDTVERTWNILDVRKTWTCSGEAVTNGPSSVGDNCLNQEQQQSTASTNTETRRRRKGFSCPIRTKIAEYRRKYRQSALCTDKEWDRCSKTKCTSSSSSKSSSNSSSSDQHDDFKQRFDSRYHCNFQQNLLGAITWSSALLCGWYTSQIICVRRRHFADHKYKHEPMQICRAFEYPGQAIHSNILSYWVQTAPKNPLNQQSYWHFENEPIKPIQRVTLQSNLYPETPAVQSPKTPAHIGNAAEYLTNILGDIEFQLGVSNIDAGDYTAAVGHFKLATSHHHVGATFNLGVCFEQGLGIEKNLKMALECYQTAAAMGHAKATFNIGVFYVRGLAGLKRNKTLARQYFITAARLGQSEARDALGIIDFNKDKDVNGETKASLPSFNGSIGSRSPDSGIYGSVIST